jgi:hypothetical protein
MYIKGSISAVETAIPYISGKSKLNLTSPPDCEHWEKDAIVISLKQSDGAIAATNFGRELKITFFEGSLYRVSPSPVPGFSLTCVIDGYPAELYFPGTGGSSGDLTIKMYKGDAGKEITYSFNIYSKEIRINSASGYSQILNYGTEAYDEAGYIIADLMDKIMLEAYAKVGITSDASDNIALSKDLRGASLSIRKIPEDNKVVFTLSGSGGGKYVFDYDTVTGSLRTQGEALNDLYSLDAGTLDTWLASLSSDYFASLPDAGTVTTAGVRASMVSSSDIQKLLGLAVIGPANLIGTKGKIETGLNLAAKILSATLYPKDYVGPVEIISGQLKTDSGGNIYGLDNIRGTAPPGKTLKVFAGASSYTTTVRSDGQWQVDDDIMLFAGENKINAVCYGEDGCEVESGDVTVYRSDPYCALVLPADRQVVWGDFVDIGGGILKCKINLHGYAQEGKEVKVKIPGKADKVYYSDRNWEFRDDGTIQMDLSEGENQVEIWIGDRKIIKTVIAAYKFGNTSANKYYAIRKGDLLFVSKKDNNPFDIIPKEPDHVGVYVGNRKVVEASWQEGVKDIDFMSDSKNKDYREANFLYAGQPRRIVSQSTRNGVAEKAMGHKGESYDWPFVAGILNLITGPQVCPSLLGHYNGPTWGFYCSELAYYVWEEQVGLSNVQSSTGFDLNNMLWPFNDKDHCSLLPAKLGKESMECRKLTSWD